MENLLGKTDVALVIDENESYYFIQKNGQTFQLDKKEGPREIGDSVEAFFYVDQQQKKTATTVMPVAKIGHYGFGTVTKVRRDLGVFVDIGLPNKDVVISLDYLSELKELWPKPGDKLLISLTVDDKERIWGLLADENIFLSLAKKVRREDNWQNKEVTGTVYRLKLAGTFVLTSDFYQGFIHPSERFKEPRLGEEIKARVIGISPHGYLNLSLKPRAYEVIDDDAAMILTFLQMATDHTLPFTDKSSPEEIKNQFNISKGQFKRALGHLLKEKKVVQEEGVIRLIES